MSAPLTLPLEIEAIKAILPHRYPFLLLDRVLELEEGRRVLAVKNVASDERYFIAGPGGRRLRRRAPAAAPCRAPARSPSSGSARAPRPAAGSLRGASPWTGRWSRIRGGGSLPGGAACRWTARASATTRRGW